jgi:hypothetical protein
MQRYNNETVSAESVVYLQQAKLYECVKWGKAVFFN